jgi:hypothetical protein
MHETMTPSIAATSSSELIRAPAVSHTAKIHKSGVKLHAIDHLANEL